MPDFDSLEQERESRSRQVNGPQTQFILAMEPIADGYRAIPILGSDLGSAGPFSSERCGSRRVIQGARSERSCACPRPRVEIHRFPVALKSVTLVTFAALLAWSAKSLLDGCEPVASDVSESYAAGLEMYRPGDACISPGH